MKPGDVVRVDGSLWYVRSKPARGRLAIELSAGSRSLRTVSARSVEAAWRRIANGQGAAV